MSDGNYKSTIKKCVKSNTWSCGGIIPFLKAAGNAGFEIDLNRGEAETTP
jgi:hypothetical protein